MIREREDKVNTEHNVAIVLAGGRGSRMESSVPKQYLLLDGKPLLAYSLLQFERFDPVQEIIVVAGADDLDYCRKHIVEAYSVHKVSRIVAGGRERYDSVFEGLKAVGQCDYVLIHDGARPFIDNQLLGRVMETVRAHQACAVGMPVKDTIKLCDKNGQVLHSPQREGLWAVQTPQAFRFPVIWNAFECLYRDGAIRVTDDAMVVERIEENAVQMVEGSWKNFKITTPEDLEYAEYLIQKKKTGMKKTVDSPED